MAAGNIPIYYESSWSILSTIGLVNILFGFLVVGITGYSPIALVPITVSTATAIANGLCYYAMYQSHSRNAVLVASIFAEVFWLVGTSASECACTSSNININALDPRGRNFVLQLLDTQSSS